MCGCSLLLLLQDAVKLYCLCKLPHDGDRPMLQCDGCRDWFHWDCVGLTPPGDDEDDEEIAPADFHCPFCCVKVPLSCLQSFASSCVLQDQLEPSLCCWRYRCKYIQASKRACLLCKYFLDLQYK